MLVELREFATKKKKLKMKSRSAKSSITSLGKRQIVQQACIFKS
jgi:hypothetical protein